MCKEKNLGVKFPLVLSIFDEKSKLDCLIIADPFPKMKFNDKFFVHLNIKFPPFSCDEELFLGLI